MWPRKKYWWETGPVGTPPLQSPTNTLPTDEDDPMWRVRRDIQHPDVRILPKAQSSPIIPGANFNVGSLYDMTDPNWSVASTFPAKTPQTPMAGKKGLGINDWMDALSELKTFTPKFGSLSARGVGGSGIKPSPRPLGVDALEMASADDPRKKWWKQWQGLMGAV
jgi:hypothetical protein